MSQTSCAATFVVCEFLWREITFIEIFPPHTHKCRFANKETLESKIPSEHVIICSAHFGSFCGITCCEKLGGVRVVSFPEAAKQEARKKEHENKQIREKSLSSVDREFHWARQWLNMSDNFQQHNPQNVSKRQQEVKEGSGGWGVGGGGDRCDLMCSPRGRKLYGKIPTLARVENTPTHKTPTETRITRLISPLAQC